jgi:hypothetical protein
MSNRRQLDVWEHAEQATRQKTEIWSEGNYVMIFRTIDAGSKRVTVMPFQRGEELDRLIAALEAARRPAAA